MKNDIKHYKQLKQMDIRVIIIWECELKECFNYRMEILEEEIKNFLTISLSLRISKKKNTKN